MTNVSIHNLSKKYSGSNRAALNQLTLEVNSGDLVALLGPSGCGKTTAMKMIAGLLNLSSGDIQFDGNSIIDKKPEHRNVAMMFQNHLLFPFMNVAENVGFGLKMRKLGKPEIERRVAEILELVKLPDLGDRKPSELSGGQQQRVALARALIVEPEVLLLDEPFSNLDAHLRYEMRDFLRNLQQEMNITTIFVTHDQEEAVLLADKIALIFDGKLKQYDKPENFYTQPSDEMTARFFGGQNFIKGNANGGTFQSTFGKITIPDHIRNGEGQLTFRPENVEISPSKKENVFSAKVISKIYMGTQTRIIVEVHDEAIQVLANPTTAQNVEVGADLEIALPKETLWVL